MRMMEIPDSETMVKFDGTTTLAVFSHPNHELAVFGLVRRLRPHCVFLTDGGGKRRVKETQMGLESIGLLDRAIFLDHSEASFYEAILRKDARFFLEVAREVREVHSRVDPDQVICDAVECYNPVHDMTLPIVERARYGDLECVFETPLIFQKTDPGEVYAVQSVPAGCRSTFTIGLSAEERESKLRGLNEIYSILRETLGALLLGAKHALEREVLMAAGNPLRAPAPDVALRYERRASELRSLGKVEEEIRREHYVETVLRLSLLE